MNTPTVITLAGRVDVHRLDELHEAAAGATAVVVDASAIEFLDNHALDALDELGAVLASPSDVVRITLEMTRRRLPCYGTVEAAVASVSA